MEFQLSSAHIELIKLLKLKRLAQTGGHARILVEEGEVQVNGEVEFRKRRNLVDGDLVECDGKSIRIIGSGEPETGDSGQ
jgi:ribosome-associated protein